MKMPKPAWSPTSLARANTKVCWVPCSLKLGTGFTDAQRRNPPAIGAWVTYRFRDVNPSGVPRFASFLRVREDANL